jgi:hypothetical protein
MKKQTAVEWLVEEMTNQMHLRIENTEIGIQLFEEALEMEKEQVEQAYSDGLGNGMHYERGDATESVLDEVVYYTQNYGDEKSQAESKERAANSMRLKGALDEEINQTK